MDASGRQQVLNIICRALQGLEFDIQLVLRGFVDQKLCPFEVTTVLLSTAQLWQKMCCGMHVRRPIVELGLEPEKLSSSLTRI